MPEQDLDMTWKPAPEDAINLAALRMYVLKIESLILAIYRSDPDLNRVRFPPLEALLARHIYELKVFARTGQPMVNAQGVCPGDDVVCADDGCCYPPGTCS